jgi:hypothetical protein
LRATERRFDIPSWADLAIAAWSKSMFDAAFAG